MCHQSYGDLRLRRLKNVHLNFPHYFPLYPALVIFSVPFQVERKPQNSDISLWVIYQQMVLLP